MGASTIKIEETKAANGGKYHQNRGDKGSYRRGTSRAYLYKTAQSMYKSNRTKLAEHILDGKPLDEIRSYPPIETIDGKPLDEIRSYPPIETIEARYKEIFSTESPLDNHPIFSTFRTTRSRRTCPLPSKKLLKDLRK
ncbi:hypothetical protein QE152_g22779 [Popillia japonica]|uniref:Uncharacterized protein n=1 Tax=Popillia japonica TaxID=7064 RepID=A0AAW1KJN5_POPJA